MKHSYLAAGALVAVLAIWMASGMLSGADAPEESSSAGPDDATADALMSVEVTPVELRARQREIVLQGQLEPWRRLEVRAETSGTVDAIGVIKGQRIEAGQEIASLRISSREADLAQAKAQLQSAQSEQKAAASLRQQGLQSRVQLEQANAALQAARAQLDKIELDIENTRFVAPFGGIINALPVEIGELIDHGQVVAELVDDSRFRVTAQAAQQSIDQLETGQTAEVRLLTGQTLPGEITFISPVANSQTRSFAIEAEVPNADDSVSAGVSASLVIPVETVEAAFISPSTLSLGDDGELGVKVVDDDDRVVFVPITLISTSLEGAWVGGVPAGSRVITLGQGFVNAGQQVNAVQRSGDEQQANAGL